MAISFDKLKRVPCRANVIRTQWEEYVQSWQRENTGSVIDYEAHTFSSFKNFAEYDAGAAYLIRFTTANTTSIIFPSKSIAQSSQPPVSACFRYRNTGISASADANEMSGIVGLLEPITVADYCRENNISKITRLYCSSIGEISIVNKSNGEALDDLPLFENWIVPKITWYYTGTDGARRSGSMLAVWYPYTVTSCNKTVFNALNDTYYVDINNYKNTPLYAMICAPYMTTEGGTYDYATTRGNFLSGYVTTSGRGGEAVNQTRPIVHARINPYVNFVTNPKTASVAEQIATIYDFDNVGHPFLSDTYSFVRSTTYGGLCAYPNTQLIVDYFADFGVTITTKIDEVIAPPDDTDGIINPSNPSEPIPNFPDNTSDTTPIEPAYITPSTFGSACIYTSQTLRDFLRWISDNTVNIDNWKRLFANPADVVQGINLFNLDLVTHDTTRTQLNSKTNILGVETDIPNYSMLDGYNNIVNGGSIRLMAYYGNYADYTSMSYQCYIPFVGYISLRASDVVNKTLHLYYAVDFATGSAIAFLNSENKLIYTSPCTVCGKIPLSISDKNSQTINNTLSVLGGIGGVIGGIVSGRPDKAIGAGIGAVNGLQLQTNYATRGSLSGVNIYRLLPAFIERTRFDLFLPSGEQQYLGAKYQAWAGAPSTQFATLKDCVDEKGYIESDVVVLPNCTATEQEKNEIRALIKTGIFI